MHKMHSFVFDWDSPKSDNSIRDNILQASFVLRPDLLLGHHSPVLDTCTETTFPFFNVLTHDIMAVAVWHAVAKGRHFAVILVNRECATVRVSGYNPIRDVAQDVVSDAQIKLVIQFRCDCSILLPQYVAVYIYGIPIKNHMPYCKSVK